MGALRRFYRNRVVYDLTDYVEADFDENVLICMPRFAWLQARNLMRGYGLRLNAYAAVYSDVGYEEPDAALFDKIDASISEFLSEGDMCQDLTTALNAIVVAIEGLQNCDSTCGGAGSFGAGTEDEAASSFVDTGLNWPDGFDDREEYETYKCATANAIISQILADAEYLKTVSIVGLTASALAFALFTPIPLDDLLILVGALIALGVEGLLVGAATENVDAIEASPEDYVCALYNASDAGDAAETLQERFDADVSAIAATLAGWWIKNVSMNALFEKSATYEQVSGTMSLDCADCFCPSWGTKWTVIDRDLTSALLESQAGPSDDFLYAAVHTKDADAPEGGGGPWGPYCGEVPSYTVVDNAGEAPDFYATFDDAGDPIIPAWTAWAGSYAGNARSIFFKRPGGTGRFRMQYDFD